MIKDFEVGVDKLEFFGHEQSIHDLKLHQAGDDVVIEFNQGVAILEHVSLTGLMQHQGDFIFL